jgi:Phosphodiester glycosidase
VLRSLRAPLALALVISAFFAAVADASTKPTHSTASKVTPVSITTTTLLTEAPPGWTVASTGPRGITALTKTMPGSAGASLTVMEFPAGMTVFHLHVGSTDPPGATSLAPVDAGTAVSAAELGLLVAAFNGGFKRADAHGGMMVDGTVVSPLVTGAASAVINADGSLQIGAWNQSVPTPGERVSSVRQNLTLLVNDGGAEASANNPALWGATIGGNSTARSALGIDRAGNVYYVGSMHALPIELADAMVSLGAMRAMQLDINPNWITLGSTTSPGGPLTATVPGQSHSPAIFTQGWSRDFFTVLAEPQRNCRLVFPAPPMVATPNPPEVLCGSIGIRPISSRS